MKILQTTDHLGFGGVQQVVVDLANGLVAAGMQVTVVAGEGPMRAEFNSRVALRIAPRGRNPWIGRLRIYFWLMREVATGRYEVVHAHQRGVAVAALVARVFARNRVAVVEHVHNTFNAGRFAKLISFRGDVLVACGSKISAMLTDTFGRDPARVVTILNGSRDIAVRRFPSETFGQIRVVGIGRLHSQKDPMRFARVAAWAGRQSPGARLRFGWAGTGPLAGAMASAVQSEGIQDDFDLWGHRSDLSDILASSDLFVLTSVHEGLPLSALEALSSGVPVLLPDVGSCRDIIEVAGTLEVGEVYDPTLGDSVLAQLIADVISDGRAANWAQHARQVWESSFTVGRVIEDVTRLYMAVAAQPPRGQQLS